MERPDVPTGLPADIEDKKAKARASVRRTARRGSAPAFEKLEYNVIGPQASWCAGPLRAKILATRRRAKAAVAVMSMIGGSVFEKVGVHTSTVFGEFSPEFRKQMPGAGRTRASGRQRDFADRPSLESQRALRFT